MARACPRFHRAYRLEGEAAFALPQQEFGLDVIALVGRLRYGSHASVPEMHAELRRRGVDVAERSVTELLSRYDELVAVAATRPERLRGRLAGQGRAVLAIDGLQRSQRGHRRRPAAAGRLRAPAQRSARGGVGEPGACRRKGGLSKELRTLRRLVGRGLAATAPLWPDIARAFAWVHRAAHLLKNADGLAPAAARQRLDGLCAAMMRHRNLAGTLSAAVGHFAKVTRSYRPGLFHSQAVPGLPTTNNALEGLFGSHRHHERRATGRRSASPAMVLRGAARLPAAAISRVAPMEAADLAAVDRDQWRALRARLDARRVRRAHGARFRRDPNAYLSRLEATWNDNTK